ncbi:hypothetical protein MPOCJGCO_2394 [Methylobacterium trifolii]|uniref:Uncharacterized protein n=1 Tax=Methylobacterium trifolii TaxID=1003092 RepID=A0ABQ4TYG8_9HYPH|nr:hypothetical protein MPOCJGCO_2394 [Methylobacterium trifolii]
MEAALGFDWPAYLALLQDHHLLARGLAWAYHSSGPQVALVSAILRSDIVQGCPICDVNSDTYVTKFVRICLF